VSATALVTGASSGIGAAFAEGLARRGHDLVLVARSADALRRRAGELEERHGVRVLTLPADLTDPGAPHRIVDHLTTRGTTVDVLVNNAGAAHRGPVAETAPELLTAMVQLNVTAVVDLTTRLLPGMLDRGRGDVITVASTAGFQPMPHLTTYAATKAFARSFTEALAGETRGTGVRVLAVHPGATATAMGEGPRWLQRSPEQVVETTFRALERGRRSVVDGLGNAVLARVVGQRVSGRIVAGLAERVLGS
jgi:short-subunit dehydrogenase